MSQIRESIYNFQETATSVYIIDYTFPFYEMQNYERTPDMASNPRSAKVARGGKVADQAATAHVCEQTSYTFTPPVRGGEVKSH